MNNFFERNENNKKFDFFELELIYSKAINNAEISAFLILFNLYFNEKIIQRTLLNKNVKYIGINYKEIDENYCGLYIIFSQ